MPVHALEPNDGLYDEHQAPAQAVVDACLALVERVRC